MIRVYNPMRFFSLPPQPLPRHRILSISEPEQAVSHRLQSRQTRRNRRKLPRNAARGGEARAVANGGKIHWLDSSYKAAILTGAIFILHLAGLVLLYSPVSGLVDSAPIIDQDWGLHFHHLRSLEQFWRQDKQLWGYNSFFMAGYPSNTIQDLSIKLFEFSALLLASFALTSVQWFKLLAFLAVASVPWLMYFAARNLWNEEDLKTLAPSMAALLGTAYWWNSLPREMYFYGMLGYPMACYFALWGISVVYSIATKPAPWSTALFGWFVFAMIAPSLHVQTAIIFIPPLAALLVAQPKLFQRRFLLWLVAAAALSLVVNLVWLVPAVSHLKDDVSASIVEQLPLFVSADPLTFVKDYFGPQSYWSFRPTWAEKGLRWTLLALGLLGTLKLLRGEQKSLAAMLASALVALFIISYFGSLLPFMKAWQPLRFKVAYDLFLVLAASYAAAAWASSRVQIPAPLVICALIFAGATFLFNLAATESLGKMRLRTELQPEINGIVDWIKAETPTEGRVLFEESGDETGFIYDGTYLSSFVPYLTGRQLIGGPINLYNDRHSFAEFHSGKFFGKEIHRLTNDEIRSYFRLYNISAVVAFHPASIQRLQSIAGLVSVRQRIGPVHLMTVHQPLSWFLQGEGNVIAELGRLRVSHVKGREIIIKYHWVEGLTATPALKILPAKMLDDPIPFIKIIDPPAAFILKIEKWLLPRLGAS